MLLWSSFNQKWKVLTHFGKTFQAQILWSVIHCFLDCYVWMDEWTEKHGKTSRHIFASFCYTCTNSGEWSSQLCFTDLDVLGRLLRTSECRVLKIVIHEVNCLTLEVLCILQSLLRYVNADFSTFKLFDFWDSSNYHTYFYIGLSKHCAKTFSVVSHM